LAGLSFENVSTQYIRSAILVNNGILSATSCIVIPEASFSKSVTVSRFASLSKGSILVYHCSNAPCAASSFVEANEKESWIWQGLSFPAFDRNASIFFAVPSISSAVVISPSAQCPAQAAVCSEIAAQNNRGFE